LTATRVFIGFSVFAWLPYGVFSFFQPTFLGEVAGVMATTPTATTEIRAMYGGLEAAIGVLCAAALVRSALVQPALIMLAFLSGGLASTRALGLLLDGGASGYTLGALGFEAFNTAVATILARKHEA
jgi:hypothetical protein